MTDDAPSQPPADRRSRLAGRAKPDASATPAASGREGPLERDVDDALDLRWTGRPAASSAPAKGRPAPAAFEAVQAPAGTSPAAPPPGEPSRRDRAPNPTSPIRSVADGARPAHAAALAAVPSPAREPPSPQAPPAATPVVAAAAAATTPAAAPAVATAATLSASTAAAPAEPPRSRAALLRAAQHAKPGVGLLERDASGKTPGVASPRMDLPPGGPVAVIPPVPPGHREVELTPMVPDRAWVRILYDEAAHTYLYEVVEPALSAEEQRVREFLRDTLVRTLDGRQGRDHDWEAVLVAAVRQAIVDHSIRITDAGARRLEYYMVRDFLGYGPIDVLMRDPMLEDISCDGPQIPLYLFHRKYESVRSNVKFADELELDSFVIRLAQRSRKHISIADPLLDATLPDGSRLQCTLSREVTTRGSSFTIRKFRADPLSPPDLVRYGTFSAEMAGWFWFAMEVGSSFLLAGGTASGKTTTLNAVSQFIPPEKKIVSIEDTREINLSHENWIAGVTRSGFGGEVVGGKIAGTIDMYKLLEAALRQRPEYLLVGEVRGPEALTLFQAMATGHAVYSTMHADSVQSAVYRLENEPINVPRMMLQTLDILAIQAQVRRGEKMTRRLMEVTEIVGYEPETKELLTNTVFEWDPVTDQHRYLGKSYVLEQVMEARNLGEDKVETEWRRRVQVIEWMMRRNVRRVGEVAAIVSQYYRNPDALMARMLEDGDTLSAAPATKPVAQAAPAAAAPKGPPEAPGAGAKTLPKEPTHGPA